MNHNPRNPWTGAIALLALVVLIGVACAPITITSNAAPAATALPASNVVSVPNATAVPNFTPVNGASTTDPQMPFRFILIHSVFSPDQDNPSAVTVTRDGQDLTFPTDTSALVTTGSGWFNPNSKQANGSGQYAIYKNPGEIASQGAWQVTNFVSWQQLPGGYPAQLKVSDSTPPPGLVRSAGILTLNVKLENVGDGQMVVHSKFLNTPDPNDTLLEGITLATANYKFMEPAHDETSDIDEGSRFYIPTSAGPSISSSPFDFVQTYWNRLTGHGDQVAICHRTGSATNAFESISVSENAVPAHLGHGDHLGNCTNDEEGKPQPGNTNSGSGKVTICHKTGSEKNPGVTITVSQNAESAHLAHGDTVGACLDQNGKPIGKGKPEPKK